MRHEFLQTVTVIFFSIVFKWYTVKVRPVRLYTNQTGLMMSSNEYTRWSIQSFETACEWKHGEAEPICTVFLYVPVTGTFNIINWRAWLGGLCQTGSYGPESPSSLTLPCLYQPSSFQRKYTEFSGFFPLINYQNLRCHPVLHMHQRSLWWCLKIMGFSCPSPALCSLISAP